MCIDVHVYNHVYIYTHAYVHVHAHVDVHVYVHPVPGQGAAVAPSKIDGSTLFAVPVAWLPCSQGKGFGGLGL